jgi:hypothetical protein
MRIIDLMQTLQNRHFYHQAGNAGGILWDFLLRRGTVSIPLHRYHLGAPPARQFRGASRGGRDSFLPVSPVFVGVLGPILDFLPNLHSLILGLPLDRSLIF